MKTFITSSPRKAAAYIRRGEVVAFPTETVYGLGANVFNAGAVRKIFSAKGRPADNPLIVHIMSRNQLPLLSTDIPRSAQLLMREFFPGPLTVILKKSKDIPAVVTAGMDTVGIRMPSLPLTRKFLLECGMPVAAPSANRSGTPSPTTWHAVKDDLDGRISCILKGERAIHGVESTVVDCTIDRPLILRTGAITLEQLRHVLPSIGITRSGVPGHPRSPGTKYRHYAPRARVRIISSTAAIRNPLRSAYIGLSKPGTALAAEKVCRSPKEYAHALYHFFRSCDRKGIETVYCQRVPLSGLGRTIMERLGKASRHE